MRVIVAARRRRLRLQGPAAPEPPVLAAMAAAVVGAGQVALTTRQQMFAYTGYRTPTIQRVRLGADADGRLQAIVHDVRSSRPRG